VSITRVAIDAVLPLRIATSVIPNTSNIVVEVTA